MKKKVFFSVILFFLITSLFVPTIVSAACPCYCADTSSNNSVYIGVKATEADCDAACGEASYKCGTATQESQTATPGKPVTITDPLNLQGGGLMTLYARLIQALLGFVGIASLVTFVYAGFMFIFSGGSSDKVLKAKQTMLYAVIGIVVSMASYAILSFIFTTLEKGTGN